VRAAAARTGLTERLEDATGDVARAWQALQELGLARPLGPDLQIEYPVAAPWDGGSLLMGYVDLIGATSDCVTILDFKTDTPPAGPVDAVYPEYASQVSLYGGILRVTGVLGERNVRWGLLFTGDGEVRWVPQPTAS
jgi:hypothetical protein